MPGPDELPDERLDVRVVREYGLSRRRAQEAIASGQVDVAGLRTRDAALRVPRGETVLYDANRRRQGGLRLSLPAIFQDETLVVVDKPPGLLSVPTDGAGSRDDSVLGRLRRDLERLRGPRAYVGALHRLDRGTSGLLAVALSRECHAAGRAAFRDHAYVRLYRAIVEGVPRKPAGTIDLPIADEYESGKRHIAQDDEEPSRRAVTHYRTVERFQKAALLELELDTGRQHQIRLHLRAIGHPIVGDGVYGRKEHTNGRPLLHASQLSFPHPLTHAPIACVSEPPRDFEDALRRLRRARQGGR